MQNTTSEASAVALAGSDRSTSTVRARSASDSDPELQSKVRHRSSSPERPTSPAHDPKSVLDATALAADTHRQELETLYTGQIDSLQRNNPQLKRKIKPHENNDSDDDTGTRSRHYSKSTATKADDSTNHVGRLRATRNFVFTRQFFGGVITGLGIGGTLYALREHMPSSDSFGTFFSNFKFWQNS